jgi:hypothetical protein
MNAVWKKLRPQFVHRFEDFEKDESYEDVANKILKFVEQLELDAGTACVGEFLDNHKAELINEELIELEAATAKEEGKAETEDDPVEESQRFITKETVTAFREISSAMVRSDQKDPSSS